MAKNPTLGGQVSQARRRLGLSQKSLAAIVKREDGSSFSPQYLNDIEHDRRSPKSELLVEQLSHILQIDADYLYYLAGRIPPDLVRTGSSPAGVSRALTVLRKALHP